MKNTKEKTKWTNQVFKGYHTCKIVINLSMTDIKTQKQLIPI